MAKSQVRRGKLPDKPPAPQLALAAKEVPATDDWGHEIKIDGYRMLCRRDGSDVRFISRNGKDWTSKVQPLVAAINQLSVGEFIIDGEVAVAGTDGVTDFQLLQNTISKPNPVGLVYFIFDVLHFRDLDIKPVPLFERKFVLKKLLANCQTPALQLSDCIVGNGPLIFENARAMGVEGIVSKRLTAPYRSGRSDAWLKLKYNQRSEFVVVGFTDSESVDHALGAMMLAQPLVDGGLRYVGRVGTGFSQATLVRLRARLEANRVQKCSLPEVPKDVPARDAKWVEPELIVEVEFHKRSAEGNLRFPSFKGIRDDLTLSDLTPA
ncbi:MAG: non-homologous end-joining DNA ligase [Planctomycetaceae bacterium]